MIETKKTMGLYIHIPYCQKECHYCDFLKFINRDDTIDDYIHYLLKEIELYRENNYLVDTIYFGGGTPSYIDSSYIVQIISKIREIFEVADDCELSIEMNPESVTKEKLTDYLNAGMNRFTMGIQSFDDKVLRMMGRVHRRETIFEKLDLMHQLGIENIGIDLMFGNPKQNYEILKSDVEQAMELDVKHISYYSLMIKENTAFARWVQTGQFILLDDEQERDMYYLIQQTLQENGFEQYEVSNFAKPGHQSRHNKKYWTLENYIGLGLGASSNIDLVRFINVSDFEEHYEKIDAGQFPVHESETMNKEEREKEYIMLNMRLLQGFELNKFKDRFGVDFLEKYSAAVQKHLQFKTIEITENRLHFTDYGLDIGNQFYLDIL
ncbi:radical SAM family heme chaperone HemW [Aerococcaceae bacterium DSM 111022]|nr:radical SAM family heme chaperone HemW [Aerococcaceae bacterium DSM 111022]